MTCNICCEKYNKSLHAKVTCICEFDACKTCIRTYLLSTTKDPHCMKCKNQWSNKFVIDNLNRSYIDGDYKNHRKTLLVDREISRTPELMNLVERTKLIEEKIQEIDEINIRFKEVRKLYNELSKKLSEKKHDLSRIRTGEKIIDRKKFIMPCPGENCKGYLSSQYKCEICKVHTCPHCYEIIGYNKDDAHICIEANLQTTALIKKETKGCPQCGVRIYKISGCDQMWCTECKVAFNWGNGKIIYGGQVHNPHYYQYMREQNDEQTATRNPGDVLCGGLVTYNVFSYFVRYINEYNQPKWFDMMKNDVVINQFTQEYKIDTIAQITTILLHLHRTVNHINNVNLFNTRTKVRILDNNDELTIQYILNKKTKKQLATDIYKNDVSRKKHTELLNIYELLGVVGIEKFTNLMDLYKNINKNQATSFSGGPLNIENLSLLVHAVINVITEYHNLLNYCNRLSVDISINYNQSVTLIQYFHSKYKYHVLNGKYTIASFEKILNFGKYNNNSEASSSSDNK